MAAITVYTKPGCAQCDAGFRVVDEMGVSYRQLDISTDHDARGYVMALGYLFFSWFLHVS
jgi:glutaredoxin-like protein NrdH